MYKAEVGIRDTSVTGVQTCALPISSSGDQFPGRERWRQCRPCRREAVRGDPRNGEVRSETAMANRYFDPEGLARIGKMELVRSEERRVGYERKLWITEAVVYERDTL